MFVSICCGKHYFAPVNLSTVAKICLAAAKIHKKIRIYQRNGQKYLSKAWKNKKAEKCFPMSIRMITFAENNGDVIAAQISA